MTQHDCEQFLDKVDLVLDGEMSPRERELFMQELEQCSHCLEQYNISSSFKKLLAKRIQRMPLEQELKNKIRSRIRTSSSSEI